MEEKYERLGRVTTESVHKCTGKHWRQWVALLDKAGARTWTHQEIVAYLKSKHRLGPWWQQGVTSGYEIAIGRRIEGQNIKGHYMVTVTKSVELSAAQCWEHLVSDKGLGTWLKSLYDVAVKPGSQFETKDGFFGEIRTMKKGRSLRLTWQDPNWDKKTVVQVFIVARSKGKKSIVAFSHGEIKDLKTQKLLRARWKQVMTDLF